MFFSYVFGRTTSLFCDFDSGQSAGEEVDLRRTPQEESTMSTHGGRTESDPGILMVRISGTAAAPAEVSFAQGDESLDSQALANGTTISARKRDVMTPRLDTGSDADGANEAGTPTRKESTITQELTGQAAEGGFEPTESGGEQCGIGDIALERVDDIDAPSEDGDKDFGTELCAQREFAANDGTDVVFVKRNNAVRDGSETASDGALLMEDDPGFGFDLFEGFQEVPDFRILTTARSQQMSGSGA